MPLKLKSSQTGDDFKLPSTNRYEIYKVVLKEMQEAADALPSGMPTDERINKWAAKAMLARVALYAGGYSLQRSSKQMERPANYLDYYTLAKKQIDEIIAQNPYKLNPSYAQVFKNQCQGILEPTENIFQVAFNNSDNNTVSGNSLGVIFGSAITANGAYNAATVSRTLVVRPFYDSFEAGDSRRDFSIANYIIDAAGNKQPQVTARQDEAWKAAKWSREYQKKEVTEVGTTRINYVLMRYSDLLLMRAEVENELNNGPNATAYDAINQIRRRAYNIDLPGSGISINVTAPGSGYTAATTIKFQVTGGGGTDAAVGAVTVNATTKGIATIKVMNSGTGYTSVPTVTITSTDGKGSGATAVATLLTKPTTADLPAGLSKDSFLQAIQQERAWELAYEGVRRSDLIRWNILKQTLSDANTKTKAIRSNYNYTAFTNFVANKHELFPIPLSEIDVNKNVGQNPGY